MSEEHNSILVEFIYLPVINYAMQQNGVSIIREISIENQTSENYKYLKVELLTEPEFATSVPYVVEIVPAGETLRIESFKLNLSTDFFAQLTEKLSGNIMIKVSSEERTLIRQIYPIEILAFDQWEGISVLPEMLSSFVTPNHPAITPIIKRASEILKFWTGNASLDEYQSRSRDRVKKQMGAVYTAISEMNITYCKSPASFEEYGQRIRLVDTIISGKLANCLDMSLLYASCLEAIGIHPLIIIMQGHAFAGGWHTPETFPDSIVDDYCFLTKRTADGIYEITLVETTCINYGSNINFDEAIRAANNKLSQSHDFILALDVKRSRFSGIRPLPKRIQQGMKWEIKESEQDSQDQSLKLPEAVNPYDLSGIHTEIEVTRQLLWERKLLDLSLRNNLLNMRMTRNMLQLISADLHKFEDALADGKEFRIMPKPTDWNNPLYEFGLYHSLHSSDPIIELIKSELTQNRLRSYLNEQELGKSLQHLYRSSRLSIEENGANTLYIALGLMKWYETPNSERPRYAPILLLPVEMVRKSAAKGYIIRSREEETMMNITLLEMLRQNFGITIAGLDPLPVDESGINVKLIYSIIRNSIKDQKKWDVEEQAVLGIFSFNKFIMWNDIHNNAHKLIENKIVLSLINGRLEWDVQEDMADATVLDKELTPSDIVLPISADSSQLEAIYEAINDKSYVLHGPPGTGKSQTITNIIANALYKGKRVLFVAEKMAALSVVQSRLAAIGLDPFCLELHSNKTKKSAILAQLKKTTEAIKYSSPEEFSKQADRLHQLRSELNTYVEALHKVYPFGLSLYDSITRYLSIENDTEFFFHGSLIENLTKDTVSEWEDTIELMVSTGKACGHPYKHPLTGIVLPGYSAEIKENITNSLKEYSEVLTLLKSKFTLFQTLFETPAVNYTKQQSDILSSIVNILLNIPELNAGLLRWPGLNELLEEYKEVIPHGIKRDEIKKEILSTQNTGILSIHQAKQWLAEWDHASGQWFLPRFIGQYKIKKQLKPYSLNGAVSTIHVKPLLSKVIDYQEEEKKLSPYIDNIPRFFGKFGRKEQEDWNTIEKVVDQLSNLNTLIFAYAKDISTAGQMKESLSRQLTEGISSFRSIYGNSLSGLEELFIRLQKAENSLHVSAGVIASDSLYDTSEYWLNNALIRLNQWSLNIDKLKDWYQWLSVKQKLAQLELGFIADDYTDKNIPTAQLKDIFNKSLSKAYINYIISHESKLELFNGKLFDDVIDRYKELAGKFESLTRRELYAKLASNIPSFVREATQNSEVGILQRNIKNNGRGTSIRKLFDQIPTLLSRMCPCMLMSPISVAQYIDPEAEKFDLIIFDEASQVPTYEAVGAIARGKNVVIVGDPKQMPPTNFFSVNNTDEDYIDMEDLESILDDCLALSMPSKYLLWHYRSKHESLISFSNSEYYDNKLLTFPSPDNQESKVRLVPVQGVYDKGRTRQNKAEAQAVINEINRRLEDKELRKRSIGVVTFSAVQQTLIEDLLSDLFLLRPDLETIAYESDEPLFIKNLENVQGDERDVILFSVGYGPDAEGKVSMNFGPLNRTGGERRLNVAVSRARYEMIIYSTLRSEQIDLNRSNSVGVAGLKRFLEYAEKGKMVGTDTQMTIDNSISIEKIIADKLRESGYEVHTNIGCSGYKVDIGIVDPECPSNYILGILCDGVNYKETKTARDREIVQATVLKLLGWNILRVWTMDWWENPESVLETIKKKIEQNETAKQANIDSLDHQETLHLPEGQLSVISETMNEEPYKETYLKPLAGSPDIFMYAENKKRILSQIQNVIEKEAPISRNLLCKRILSAWGISRMGIRLDSYFETLLEESPFYKTEHGEAIFFWLDKEQCITYNKYRPNSGRDAADLPPEEIANAIKSILKQEISMPLKDLSRITAQYLGFARLGNNVDAAVDKGINEAVKRKYIRVENEKAVLI